jgi:hypothetical protein
MKVEVLETTLVAPSEATPRHGIWLSNLDLAVPKTHTPLVYYYPKPEGADDDAGSFLDPARLRDALARALVPFYPLAGRLANGPGGRIEIDCTGEGALFAVAKADFTGDEVFREFEPSPEARRLLVPFAESGEPPCLLAMVQVRSRPASCYSFTLPLSCRLPGQASPTSTWRFACPCRLKIKQKTRTPLCLLPLHVPLYSGPLLKMAHRDRDSV